MYQCPPLRQTMESQSLPSTLQPQTSNMTQWSLQSKILIGLLSLLILCGLGVFISYPFKGFHEGWSLVVLTL